MSDPRFHGPTFIGAPLTRQQKLNQRHRDYCNSHPASYGWTVAIINRQYQLPVFQKSGAFLMRHPGGDCWLLHWFGCWQPVDLHISQLSEKLETLKAHIEFEIAMEEFGAAVEAMAA